MLTALTPTPAESIARRTSELFAAYRLDINRRTDRLFAGLMAFQWLLGIAFALWVSPLTWEGDVSTHASSRVGRDLAWRRDQPLPRPARHGSAPGTRRRGTSSPWRRC